MARPTAARSRTLVAPEPGVPSEARDALLAWYDAGGRTLPFRTSRDPWAILVSEAMAQQTQAARAGEKWLAFMERFPSVEALAAATPADVLRSWQGLGYNRRALNLWRAARAIVDDHRGQVPGNVASLRRLPGVGPYTARAVAAIAFGLQVGAVDTNVRRVLTRVVRGAHASEASAADVQRIADAAVPNERPGDWTHALMDVGATLCRPRSPSCGQCPLQAWCRYATARIQGVATEPRRRAAPPQPFTTTSRWLRGRLLDRLREARGDAWTVVGAPLGVFDEASIAGALRRLAADGLVELHPSEPRTARLPIG